MIIMSVKKEPRNVIKCILKGPKNYIFNSFICCTFVEKLIGLKMAVFVGCEQTPPLPSPLACSPGFSVHTSVAAFFSSPSAGHRLLEPSTGEKMTPRD